MNTNKREKVDERCWFRSEEAAAMPRRGVAVRCGTRSMARAGGEKVEILSRGNEYKLILLSLTRSRVRKVVHVQNI